MGNIAFRLSDRLGIELPVIDGEWDGIPKAERAAALARWESIRGSIPDRIFALERRIHMLQARLFEEDDFGASCALNWDIAELASRINDLHIWYRINQEIETRRHS
ncbi:hypothetical protein BG53_08045 [Paenibacillus darwinianus]|uniref:Uncharacterized protein n=1 Tax=Paenibacillus darwinianus TaxID=1380763 RepID=A0A9W5W6M9_9BACL|nr:hypothetical protein [Paenibacillus darwinianus]EXX85520.1 hypothetical protein CH50_09290 [Paenibacillus darwinianus]EXX85583.1 hypothetical protein BG53_08045 [Paenibacillus darwinianus]EXX85758.1 hypothetical protein BG52_07695 [Paenibacillus darwinianus]